MRITSKRILTVAAIACSACAGQFGSIAPASAAPPMSASGAFTFGSDTFTPLRTADGNTFFTEDATLVYTGDLTGPASDTATTLVYSDGSFSSHGTEVCTACILAGRTGDFTAVFTLAGSPTGQYAGHETFVRGTGGLAGLHGGGTFQGNGTANTYSYHYFFAP